jgi:uncharacterized Tic20 family protein
VCDEAHKQLIAAKGVKPKQEYHTVIETSFPSERVSFRFKRFMNFITDISLFALGLALLSVAWPTWNMLRKKHAFGHSRLNWTIALVVNIIFATINIHLGSSLLGIGNTLIAAVALIALVATHRLPAEPEQLISDLDTEEFDAIHTAVIDEALQRDPEHYERRTLALIEG